MPNSKCTTAIVAHCVIFGIGAAAAADLPRKAVPMLTPAWTWSGWYVGGNVGWGFGQSSGTNLSVVNPGNAGSIGVFLGTGFPGFQQWRTCIRAFSRLASRVDCSSVSIGSSTMSYWVRWPISRLPDSTPVLPSTVIRPHSRQRNRDLDGQDRLVRELFAARSDTRSETGWRTAPEASLTATFPANWSCSARPGARAAGASILAAAILR